MRRLLLNGQHRQACDALLRWRFAGGKDCSVRKNGSKVVDAVYEKAKGNEVVILNEFDFLTSPNIEITMFDAEVRSDIGYGEYGLNRIEIIEA